MEEIFLIHYEKIIFNIRTLIVPQRQSKTFCWTQWLLHLRLNHKVQVEKKEHLVNAVSPRKDIEVDSVMNSQMKQAINPKQDCSFYVMLETQKEDNAAEMIYMYPLAGMGHFCHNL